MLRKLPAHPLLGLYGSPNALRCLLDLQQLGWVSFVAVFASYFFLAIMFPTFFALGIQNLGAEANRASVDTVHGP